MIRVRTKSWLPSTLPLVLLLVGAQCGALAHAFKHDVDVLQQQTCATCVTVSQLDSSCVGAPGNTDIEHSHSYHTNEHAIAVESFHALVVRQRGPPNPL
jgi:hypothetical protein